MRRRRSLLIVAPIFALVTALPGAAQSQEQPAFEHATFAEQGTRPMRVTAPVQMTEERETPVRAFTGPSSILVHPTNPRLMVAAVVDLRTKICELIRTTDGGQTWHFTEARPHPTDYAKCMDNSAGKPAAAIAWGQDDTLYYSAQAYGEGEGGFRIGRVSHLVARSDDFGDSWTSVIVENNRGKPEPAPHTFGAAVAVDTSGPEDVVYAGYAVFYTEVPDGSDLGHGKMRVAVSTDGGETFSDGVDVNTFSDLTHTVDGTDYPIIMEGLFGGPSLIAHDGTVLVVSGAQFTVGNVPDDGSTFGTAFSTALPQLVARSTDQGETWTFSKMGPPKFSAAGSQTGLGWVPQGGPDGTFLAAYQATPEGASSAGPAQIVVQRSTDDGVTWTDPVALNDDDPSAQYASFYPQMGVAPNGRVDVVWQDNREQTDFLINIRYSYSTDGGQTWEPNMVVSDRPVDFKLGVSSHSDLRHPPGVASADEFAWMGWADTRMATELTQTQDNYGAAVQFETLPASSNTVLPLIAAAAGGLLLAGLVLLGMVLVRRRGAPPGPRAQPAGRG